MSTAKVKDAKEPLNVELRAARMKLNLHKKYYHADTPTMEANWDEAMETIGKTIAALEEAAPAPPSDEAATKTLKVGRFYKMTPTGKRILTLMKEGKTVEEAVAIADADSSKSERSREA